MLGCVYIQRKNAFACMHVRYCFISQLCLCLHLPWVDMKVLHPALSFITEEITVTSLFGALCAAGENIVIVCHCASLFFLPLIDYSMADMSCFALGLPGM